jgi:signal transduction histidine kinase
MRNNVLSLISHDLKTPLARIQAMLERLGGGDFGALSPQQREAIDRILSANGHLQRTISTLLLLSRIESRDFRIRPQPTDLRELLQLAVRHHQAAASERGIGIETDFEPLFLVDMDRALIEEVLNNLIDNALKYSPAGSTVSIRCGEQDNCPELSPPQAGVWLEIQDCGPGIPPEDRARVLQKFVRGSNERTAADQSVKGTGLGLYLSAFFVEKHLGALSLTSRVEGEKISPASTAAQYFDDGQTGTCIRVTLPVEANYEETEASDRLAALDGRS